MPIGFSKDALISYFATSKIYLYAFLVYLIISFVLFWQITTNISSAMVNSPDAYLFLFLLWWVPYSIFTLGKNPYFTNLMYHPIGASLVSGMMPISGILSWPIQQLGSIFNYNFLFFLSFALSGLFMFMLAQYITKNRHAAFIAGIIFAFSPVHIAQAYAGHLDWTIIEFLPLFVLFLILTIKEKKILYIILTAASILLLTFAGGIEQGVMAIVIAIAIILVLAVTERNLILAKKTLLSLCMVAVLALILSSPFLLAMAQDFEPGTLQTANAGTSLFSTMYYSDNLLSFFLPSYYNGIFHGLSMLYSNQLYGFSYQGANYAVNYAEKTSYVGYSVLALALLGIYYDYKHHKMKNTILWLSLLLIFFMLSLGPLLQIGSAITSLPTIYYLYLHIPLFNLVREPGRFDVIFTIFLSILAAMGFVAITSKKDKKTSFLYTIAIVALILLEYNGTPLGHALASSTTATPTIPQIYYNISKMPGNFSVMILPVIPVDTNLNEPYQGMEDYYVTALHRPIIGGDLTRTNNTQTLTRSVMPLEVQAAYLESGQGLIYSSPIIENYSNLTLFWLDDYNIKFISLIKQAYSLQEQQLLANYLTSLFGEPIYQDNNSIVFETSQRISTFNSLVAYTDNNWVSGEELCTEQNCNSTISSLWWGYNERSILVYSPSNQQVQLNFQALSFQSPSQVTVYINGAQQTSLDLEQSLSNYAMNLTVVRGLNQVTFYTPASSVSSQNPYLNYGIDDVRLIVE